MSRASYGRVRHSFWTDPDVRRLSVEAKTLLLYYATSPHSNMAGVYYCPHAYTASETGLAAGVVHGLVCGELARFLTFDSRTDEVFVHALAKHNIGESLSEKDKRTKGLQGMLDATHSDWLAGLFVERYSTWPVTTDRQGEPPPPPPSPLQAPSEGSGSPFEAIAVTRQVTTEHSEDKSSGASPVVENPEDVNGPPAEGTDWNEAAAWWAPFLREHNVDPHRSMSVVKQNLGKFRPDTIRDAVLGFCSMRDGGELREGLGLAPGEVMTLLPLNKKTNGRSNLQLAADRYRKDQERKGSRHGMKSIRDVLKAS